MPEVPEVYVNTVLKLLASLLTLILTLAANRGVRHLLRKRINSPTHVQTLYMLARNTVFAGGSVVILLIWLGSGSNLAVAMGILRAGAAFASQEVIGPFAG